MHVDIHLLKCALAALLFISVGVMAWAVLTAKPDPQDFDPHDN